MRAAFLAMAMVMASPCAGQDTPQQVVFTDTTPLAGNDELARRILTPLTAAHMTQALAKSGQHLRDQPVTPADESFLLHLPPVLPAGGYALMVFVPAAKTTQIPKAWTQVLDRLGVIFVSAARSGNDADVMSRRMPLALIAAANVMRQYKVDPSRVFIAGMSGGSRVAMRLALAYPDLFRGALLNSGGDPIGSLVIPLPPRELFAQFQAGSRLVYLTGENDTVNLHLDTHSAAVMRSWCVANVEERTMPGLGHQTADAISLDWALNRLLSPRPAEKRSACQARLDQEMADDFRRLDALRQAGKRAEAKALLDEIDTRFGGLAAPQSLTLDAELAAMP
jgi:predicted esterase